VNDSGTPPRSRAEEVKGWVQSALGAALPVLVTELRCSKSECPTVETVVAVLAKGAQRRWSIPRALAELGRAELEEALRARPDGDAAPQPHAPPAGTR
jgi:hypothetical protein